MNNEAPFKAGDKVVCINLEGTPTQVAELRLFGLYTVVRVDTFLGEWRPDVSKDSNYWQNAKNFVKADEH